MDRGRDRRQVGGDAHPLAAAARRPRLRPLDGVDLLQDQPADMRGAAHRVQALRRGRPLRNKRPASEPGLR